MKKFSGPLARRYGSALFESVLESSKQAGGVSVESFIEITNKLSSCFDKNIVSLFSNPIFTQEQKKELLETLLNKVFPEKNKIPSDMFNFLMLLIGNHRIEYIPVIFKYFLNKADEFLGIVRGTLISAAKATEKNISDFTHALSTSLNRKIILVTITDESLRSGFIIKIGNTNIDASLRSRLLNLKESLS